VGSQGWLSELLALLGQLPEAAWTAIGDPVDAGTGHLRGPLTDLSLGGLAPALEFSRTYDGGLLEEDGAPDTLLGATSLKPARSYIDFAPKNIESGWLRSSLSTG
jgi:hypothetical protein